ncbi:MAG: hypothetical protein WC873_01895 [Candidatus Gracilibacteria bacterium]
MGRTEIIKLANDIINKEIDIFSGSQKLYEVLPENLANRSDFLIFTLVASESDNFPIGKERERWNKIALEKKDLERTKLGKFYKQDVFEACKKILKRFSSK